MEFVATVSKYGLNSCINVSMGLIINYRKLILILILLTQAKACLFYTALAGSILSVVKCLTVFGSVLNQAVGWGWKWLAAGGA